MDEKETLYLTISITITKHVPGSNAVDNTLRLIQNQSTYNNNSDESSDEIDGNLIIKTYKHFHENITNKNNPGGNPFDGLGAEEGKN